MKNGKLFYGIQLPLGRIMDVLFLRALLFPGDQPPMSYQLRMPNYWTQDTAHARINYLYCVNNPGQYNGYSSACWDLRQAMNRMAIPHMRPVMMME